MHIDNDIMTMQKYQDGFCYTLNDIKKYVMYDEDNSKTKLQINEVFDLIEFFIKHIFTSVFN